MAGIKETKEVLNFMIALGNGVGMSLEDGVLDWSDAAFMMNALLTASDAFQDVALVPTEVGDISEGEMAELKDFVVAEFDIPQDNVEAVIEDALILGIEVFAFVNKLKALLSKEVE